MGNLRVGLTRCVIFYRAKSKQAAVPAQMRQIAHVFGKIRWVEIYRVDDTEIGIEVITYGTIVLLLANK